MFFFFLNNYTVYICLVGQPISDWSIRVVMVISKCKPDDDNDIATIRSALSSAVETLLGEIAAVMSETEDELLSKERENERLKARLDTSERELKTLQECLCSAQKLIDQLQGPFSTHPLPPPIPGQHGYTNQAPPTNAARLSHRGAGDDADPRCFANSEAELSGALGDAIHGFEARDEFKSCHLSIQADGTVTNSYYDPMAVHTAGMCHDVNRAGERLYFDPKYYL